MRKNFKKAVALGLTVALVIGSLKGLNTDSVAYASEETTVLSDSDLTTAYTETAVNHVTVHDPSIVYDGNGTYYIFGSHMAWARSTDLINWTTFTNNINTDFANLFAANITWAAMGDSVYAASGNLWAPDVIFNDTIGKWCMYMSINGCSWNSSIAMLTADTLDGDWTYAGTVIYSGFTESAYNHDFTYTDYDEVTGDAALPARYIQAAYTCKDGTTTTATTTWNRSTGAHAIDPGVFYGQDGKLYMAYGSWSGGIYIIELDEASGLRDTGVTYNYVLNSSDPYMGIKLAGGYQTSGEASYIEYIDGYYYMFVTNGGLVANGGYNMRVYRSNNPTGPYTDVSGQSPMYITGTTNTNSDVGTRLMSYYKWNYQKFAQVAQGHNSAIVGPDGKAFLVYHTRTNDGTEGHSVRVHQLFTTENHNLVAAPFEYNGETISSLGYSASEVVGTYEVIIQKQNIDYANLEYCAGVEITLKEDGTISGAYSGTWTMVNGKPYCNLTIGGVSYEGVFAEQTMEGTNINTMCFTAVSGNDVCIWGAKYPSAQAAIAMTNSNMSIVTDAYSNISLPSAGLYGTAINWSSSEPLIISNNGIVTAPSEDTNVILTATISKESFSYQKQFTVLVHKAITSYSQIQLIASAFVGNPQDLSTRLDGSLSIANPYYNNADIDYAKGVKIKFDVESTGTNKVLATILSFMGNEGGNGRLYYTPGSYLGYNATGGYFDANMRDYGLVTDYIGTAKSTITISLTSSGFEVEVNGVKAYDQTITSNAATGSGTITDYYNVLSWLTSTADKVYFGKGSWWGAAGYDEALCKISNVYFYAYLMKPDTNETHTYSEDYNMSSAIENYWTSLNLQTGLAFANRRDTQKQFAQFTVSGTSGTRGAVSAFPVAGQVTGKYTVMADVNLNAANASGIENQFAITNSARAYTSSNVNYGVASGYIIKLSALANTTTWSINGGQGTVNIPRSTWVNIKAFVDTTAGTALLKITNKLTGAILYSGTVTVSGTGTLQGLYFMGGRTTSVLRVDNIIVDQSVDGIPTSEIDLSSYNVTLDSESYTYSGSAKLPAISVSNGSVTLTEGIDYAVTYSNNINAGTVIVNIIGMLNYTGTITKTFTITARNSSALSVTLGTSTYTYDGLAKTPTVTVKDGQVPVAASNYTIDYANNNNVGTATAAITLRNDYSGTLTKTFTITPKAASGLAVTVNETSLSYDGTPKLPEVTVKDGSTTLVKGIDYSVSYLNNINAGTASVIVTGLGNYTGTMTKTFTIDKKLVSGITIILSEPTQTYDGTAKLPSVIVMDSLTTLASGIDYTVSYSNNTEVGTAAVMITGEGNYTGTAIENFTISPKDVTALNVAISDYVYLYDGTAKTPEVSVFDGGITLVEGTDYELSYADNTAIGNAVVTIIGLGNYTGSATKNFSIINNDISAFTINMETTTFVYDGTAKTPEVSVLIGTDLLEEGTDYTVLYSNNINKGTATVTITGIGEYVGTAIQSFAITAKEATYLSVSLITSTYTYDGSEKTPAVTVMDGIVALAEETDYTVSYSNNINIGVGIITITGKGNYTGATTQTFTITGKSVSLLTLSLETYSYTYDGTSKNPAVTVKDGEVLLVAGTDYTISYYNNVSSGTASVIITGKGSYIGTKSVTYTISSKSVSQLTMSLGATNFLYDGTAKTPSVALKDGARTLSVGTDYSVTYDNNVKAGIASVSVIGNGNYTGTMTQSFVIAGKGISTLAIQLEKANYTYDGNTKTPAVAVKDGTITLVNGTDYTLSYTNNKNVGAATVTVSGIGNYTGTATQTFAITGKSTSLLSVVLGTLSYTYDGTAKTPTVIVKDGAKTLAEGTDYTINYKDNTKVGTATVIITGAGNYTGSTKQTYTITAMSISKATLTLKEATYTYTGKAIKPEVEVISGTMTLTQGKDYTITYTDNIKPGKATVKITGKGNYSGTLSKTFTIQAKSPKVSLKAGTKSVNIKWDKVAGATGYVVYMATSATGSYTKIYTADKSTFSYKKTGLTSKKTYYFKIVAITKSDSKTVYSEAAVISIQTK